MNRKNRIIIKQKNRQKVRKQKETTRKKKTWRERRNKNRKK